MTADGVERQLDTIVLGTGLHVTDMPVGNWVHGADGQTLADAWRGSPQAYLGASVAGFPSFMRRHGLHTFDVRQDVQARFNQRIQHRLQGTAWNSGPIQETS